MLVGLDDFVAANNGKDMPDHAAPNGQSRACVF